jgi:hypothetical protein
MLAAFALSSALLVSVASAAGPDVIRLSVTAKTVTVSGYANESHAFAVLDFGPTKCNGASSYATYFDSPQMSGLYTTTSTFDLVPGSFKDKVDRTQLFAALGPAYARKMKFVCAYLQVYHTHPTSAATYTINPFARDGLPS